MTPIRRDRHRQNRRAARFHNIRSTNVRRKWDVLNQRPLLEEKRKTSGQSEYYSVWLHTGVAAGPAVFRMAYWRDLMTPSQHSSAG
jgi:hypothetical protein